MDRQLLCDIADMLEELMSELKFTLFIMLSIQSMIAVILGIIAISMI